MSPEWGKYDQAKADADIAVHAALTAAHGVTGAIVGTTDTQTLTNKTFVHKTTHEDGGSDELTLPLDPGTGVAKTARKSADQTLDSNSATLQDITELLFAIGANEVWAFTLILLYDSSAIADLKVGWSVPAGAAMRFLRNDFGNIADTAADTRATDGWGSGTVVITSFQAVIWNGANAGNVQLRGAQNTAEVSNTLVKLNSCIIAHKLA